MTKHTDKKRALILTADAGFGHRSAAKAIARAFEERYRDVFEVEVINPLDDRRAPAIIRDAQQDYDRLVREAPSLYKLGFEASDTTVANVLFEAGLTVLLYELMRDMVSKKKPDVIVSTYPLYQEPLDAVFTIRDMLIPVLCVVTDLETVHRVWFNKSVTKFLVPTETVRDMALKFGLSESQVHITGIPVNPALATDQRSKAEIRRSLGWRSDVPTVLAVGSKRVDRLPETLNILNHYGAPIQVAVVAGKDEELYRELQAVEWHQPVHLYEFVENVPEMMRAADFLICKAGGLVVTEALAAGCPLMLIDMIPGQETGNADHVVRNAAGVIARSDAAVLETLTHWLKDECALLSQTAENARKAGKPNAAFDVVDLAYQTTQQPMTQNRLFTRSALIEMFNRNQVRWRDSKETSIDKSK
ncbi:MAG: glycosyltransferase [Anaerolineae bacterium]|nr:glycosyltransferase [Anaerolineae bacterium]